MKRKLQVLAAFLVPVYVIILGFLAYALYHKQHDIRPTGQLNSIESLVNDTRSGYGKSPLAHSEALEEMANTRCAEMVSLGKIDAHAGFYPLIRNQTTFSAMGENLAENYPADKDLVNAWLASPEHRDNMLANWQYTAAVRCGKYVVQLFGLYP